MVKHVPYLSRVLLNPLRPQTQRMLASPRAAHAVVEGCLRAKGPDERILWRLETGRHRAELLALTHAQPSWQHVVETAGWPDGDEPHALTRDYAPLLDRIVRGAEFRFRLKANPVSTTHTLDKPSAAQIQRLARPRARGERIAHRTARHQLAWIQDPERLARWGLELATPSTDGPDGPAPDAVRLLERQTIQFDKRDADVGGPSGRRTVTLITATYEGSIRILDPGTARATLLHGVGAAKAYGCGLITLAPRT